MSYNKATSITEARWHILGLWHSGVQILARESIYKFTAGPLHIHTASQWSIFMAVNTYGTILMSRAGFDPPAQSHAS